MKSIDYDYNIYIDVEWFEHFVYNHKKNVSVCKRLKEIDMHSEVKLKTHADISSIMNTSKLIDKFRVRDNRSSQIHLAKKPFGGLVTV